MKQFFLLNSVKIENSKRRLIISSQFIVQETGQRKPKAKSQRLSQRNIPKVTMRKPKEYTESYKLKRKLPR
jgi:hypothetical protein